LGGGNGVGARVGRKEDDRFLRGKGQYIGDIRLPKTREVAFVRASVAHARLRGVQIPEAVRASVFIAQDLDGVLPIKALSPAVPWRTIGPQLSWAKTTRITPVTGTAAETVRRAARRLHHGP
jgi:CO/xanthine dehydrogenase Mo-binding subunit